MSGSIILDYELDNAASLLRRNGWTVLPPPAEAMPEPAVGQVWVSPKLRVEPRTIVKIGPHRSWSGRTCIFFTARNQPSHPDWGPSYLTLDSWAAWVRKSGARPA